MENTPVNKQSQEEVFDSLMETYKEGKNTLASNPGDHKEGYNKIAHNYSMKARAGIDLTLAKMVLLKQDEVPFMSVELMNGVYVVNFNPYGAEFDDQEAVEFDVIEAPIYKYKGFKMYEDEHGGKVKWLLSVMTSDVDMLFTARLIEDIESGFYKSKTKEFARKVSDLMRQCPHKEMETYSDWMTAFVTWLTTLESDLTVVIEIADAVMNSLHYIFFSKDRKKYEKDGKLELMVNSALSKPSWEDCSKKAHEKFALLNFKVKKNMSFMEMMRAKANAQREEKRAALEKAKGGQKRKLPEGDQQSSDESASKKAKTEKLAEDTSEKKSE